MNKSARTTAVVALLALFSLSGSAQDVTGTRRAAEALRPRLPEFGEQVPLASRELIYGWVAGLSQTPHRRPGTAEGHRAEAWLERAFRDVGLESVAADRVPIKAWKADEWSLRVGGRRVDAFFINNSGFTPGVTAPLVYVGEGGLKGLGRGRGDIKGKIVVAEGVFTYSKRPVDQRRNFFASDPRNQLSSENQTLVFPSNLLGDSLPLGFLDVFKQAQKAGAAGFAMILRGVRSEYSSLYWPYDASPQSMPGVFVAAKEGEFLRTAAKAGREATLVLRGRLEDDWIVNLSGVLPGRSDEVILITSHHDSPHQGAVEDASGIAQVLAQAWAWSRVPAAQRPRTLVFVAAGGHFHKQRGAFAFAESHPAIMRRTRALLTLEHLAAREVTAEPGGGYRTTGRPQASFVFVPADTMLVAALQNAFEKKPTLATAVQPPFLNIPWTDAVGYITWSRNKKSGYPGKDGLPYISWISSPLYLLDEGDTLDKIDQDQLAPIAETITEIVKNLMVLPPAGSTR